MARRRGTRRRARGGDGIQALRQARTRVALGALSVAVYLGVLAYAITRETDLAPIVGIIGAFGAVLLLFLLWRRAEDVLAWIVLLLGCAYVVTTFVHHRNVDAAAPIVGAALLLCTELAVWSCSERRSVRVERGVVVARAVAVTVLVLAGLGVSALVVALAAAPVGGGLGWTLIGAVAAVAVVSLVTRLARRSTAAEPRS